MRSQEFQKRFTGFLTKPLGKILGILIVGCLIVLVILIRWRGIHFFSGDMPSFLHWLSIIKKGGGFAVLRDTSFSSYNPPYLYLLSMVTYLPEIPGIIAIKSISILFDFIAAVAAWKIVRYFKPGLAAWTAFFLVLFAPTVWVNSAWWGQCDSIFTAFLLLTFYFALKDRPLLSMSMFGVALSFKFQAFFLAPFVLLLVLNGKVRWWQVFAAPVAYLVMLLPAIIAGQPLAPLLTFYVRQASTFNILTMNAPSIFAFFSRKAPDGLRYLGFGLAGLAIIAYLGLGWKARKIISDPTWVLLATMSLFMLPLLLPLMHERYFYPAAIFMILLAFVQPRLLVLPFVLQFTTFLSYLPFLINKNVLPLWVLAAINLVVFVLLTIHSQRQLSPGSLANRN